jgi:hypothetical protein
MDAQSSENTHAQSTNPQSEHDTHWGALIFLIILAVGVGGLLLTKSNGGNSSGPAGTSTYFTENADDTTPTQAVDTTQESGLSGFPDGMYVPDDYETVDNFTAQPSESTAQRVVIYDTERAVSEIKSGFTDWINASQFALAGSTTQDQSTNLNIESTENDQKRILVSISTQQTSRRVQVNYITSR